MGRRVYWGCVILVVMALQQKRPEGASANKLRRMLEIPRKTLMRWFSHFKEVFASGANWQRLGGRVSASVEDGRMPASILESFIDRAETLEKGLVNCLCFLS